MHLIRKRWWSGILVGMLAVVPTACTPIGDGGGTVVEVELDEFTVATSPGSVSEGMVTFRVRNAGNVVHEFLVIRTDLAADALPTAANGAFDEEAEGTQVVDEIEGIQPGGQSNLTLTLDAGHYALICNMVVSGTVHYAEGMSADFTVSVEQNP